MPHLPLHILADGDVDWAKLIPFAVIGVIWILRLVVSVSKQSNRSQRSTLAPPRPVSRGVLNLPPSVQPLRQPPSSRPSPAPRAAGKPRVGVSAVSRQSNAIRQVLAGTPTGAAGRRREPTLPPRRQPAAQAIRKSTSEPSGISSTRSVPLIDGPSLTRRLRPALLRYQFILTEILRPPLALREDDDDA
jgi:hypothetical protein